MSLYQICKIQLNLSHVGYSTTVYAVTVFHVSLKPVLIVLVVATSEDDRNMLQPYGTVGGSVGRKCTGKR